MEEKRHPTMNELFAEEISMLRPINPGRHCGYCGDQLFVGFNLTPDGIKQLLKCSCATFGHTEYSRIQDHLILVDKNITGSLNAIHGNMQSLVQYQEQCTSSIIKSQRLCYKGMLESLEIVHRNTFWGGIKFGIGVVLMCLHDGWLFFKKGLEQLERLKGTDDGKEQSLPDTQDTTAGGTDNVLEMPNAERARVE